MSFWEGRKVLVTGCTGFLGWWLTSELVRHKAEVTGLVRDLTPQAPFFAKGMDKKINMVRGTIEDYDTVERAINEYEIDTVFHLAAQAIVGVANRNPMSTFEANIKGTWIVMEACRQNKLVSRVVVASSDKAYGNHEVLPYNEDFALQGSHPYDVSKSCADLIALTYHNTYGTPVCVTRCGNLFGPGDMNFNRIIPGTMQSIMKNQNPVIRSDGSPMRDYVFVLDIARAYMMLAEHMDDKSIHGTAFNFGTGEPVSVLELTEKILKVAGREDLKPDVQNSAHGEILHQYLSSTKAREVLGWEPAASLSDRLQETFDWYRENA
ncbi:MAG: NAD-dependent epimerase/dehydratase family protein [Candidatus Nitronauta litoralis]|uniref:NAD-dependent epimerase/dehydratase family protein n=1 Tax=Candidatus Nitronauta litoralis TaxID=2705533 RepID=A0A7T0FZH2_9BACT|nr:MAG: NAD-dependent epimerase/dehydratase family protein [Candidatus Nitronauta litoralis]